MQMTETLVFEEEFEGALERDWRWVREEPEAWRLEDGVLHVRTLPGTLWGERNNAKNLLLRPERPAALGLASMVTVFNQPMLQGEQAGLIWYVDDANYVKLIKESLEGSVWIVMGREEDDAPVLVNRVPYLPETVRLRLLYSREKMIGQYWADDTATWITVGECEPLPYPQVQLGLFSHGGPEDKAHWAQFTRFGIAMIEAP
jgi:regulation of enolase protein 1 (concanavalin A-like superfamily)